MTLILKSPLQIGKSQCKNSFRFSQLEIGPMAWTLKLWLNIRIPTFVGIIESLGWYIQLLLYYFLIKEMVKCVHNSSSTILVFSQVAVLPQNGGCGCLSRSYCKWNSYHGMGHSKSLFTITDWFPFFFWKWVSNFNTTGECSK